MRRDGASTQMKSAPGGLQAKDPRRTGMVPGRTLSAPGWCRVQKTSECTGMVPRPTLSAPGWCRVEKDPARAPGGCWGGSLAHREGAGSKENAPGGAEASPERTGTVPGSKNQAATAALGDDDEETTTTTTTTHLVSRKTRSGAE